MSTATLEPEKKIKKMPDNLPAPVLHPLNVGQNCIYLPQGRRHSEGRHAKPASMYYRENDHMIVVLERQAGQNVMRDCLRHVDDPHLTENARGKHGAWDYCEGESYQFYVPARLRGIEAIPGITIEIGQMVLHLANLGRKPGEIAGMIAMGGVTSERIGELLELQHGSRDRQGSQERRDDIATLKRLTEQAGDVLVSVRAETAALKELLKEATAAKK